MVPQARTWLMAESGGCSDDVLIRRSNSSLSCISLRQHTHLLRSVSERGMGLAIHEGDGLLGSQRIGRGMDCDRRSITAVIAGAVRR